jgi:hypothetical protein
VEIQVLYARYRTRKTGKALYILNISASASLTNGFIYIKELLLEHHNYYLNECYQTLFRNNIHVATVKTDALTINSNDLEKAKELLNFNQGFGNWRLSKTEEIKMEDLKVNNIDLSIAEEYDVRHLCNLFEQHKRVVIRAELAGCGKSYCCEQMKTKGHNVLFVCPTNVLADKYGDDGITLNKFFSIGMTEESKLARFDDSPYDTIVFDEIFFYNIRNLCRIKRYSEQKPEKIIIATGDTCQLKAIDPISNQLNYSDYMNHCINSIFVNLMYFKENKRLPYSDNGSKVFHHG